MRCRSMVLLLARSTVSLRVGAADARLRRPLLREKKLVPAVLPRR